MSQKITEVQLAKKVIKYLEDLNWKDIYQEVQIYSGGSCADIIAINKPVVWIIECKIAAGIKVLEQAVRWKAYANMTSVAVLHTPRASRFFENTCNKFGIGVLRFGINNTDQITETLHPQFFRKTLSKRLRSKLTENHKIYGQAGQSGGDQWTPFKATCLNVLRVVNRNPGITIKDLVQKINHHYSSSSSAKTCLVKWIDSGIVPGVEIHRDKRKICIYPSKRYKRKKED